MIAVPAHGPTRGWQKQAGQPVVPGQQLQSSMPARRLQPQPKLVAGTGSYKECNPYDDVDFSALFAHLMHLGQETTATPSPLAATGKATDNPPKLQKNPTPCTTTSAREDTLFKQDSAKVLRWMKYALEDLKLDAVVVASAATLALRYLRQPPSSGGLALRRQRRTTTTVGKSSDTPTAAAASNSKSASTRGRQAERWEGRVGSETDVTVVLLSATALHLASKYHDVYGKKVESFGTKLNPERVYKLGVEISLSMGAALNSSFRANPVALQSLFCAIADESVVVRACSEWFALCLVLLLPPGDEVAATLSQRHVPTAFSDIAAVIASPSTSTGAASAATTACLNVATLDSSEGGSTTGNQRNSPFTTCISSPVSTDECVEQVKQVHQRRDARSCGFSHTTALALGALALARRLAPSEGRCLPVQVQDTMGLRNDEAQKLVAEGIAAARCVFGTGLGERGDGVNAEAGGGGCKRGGHELLAGDIVFDRVLVDVPQGVNRICRNSQGDISKNTEERTLLEWVTDCRRENPAVDSSRTDYAGDLNGRHAVCALDHPANPHQIASTSTYDKKTGALVDEEGADFVQGLPLVGAVDRFSPCPHLSKAPDSAPSSTLDGGASTANSSGTTSETGHHDTRTEIWSYSSSNSPSSSSSSNSSNNNNRSNSDSGNGEDYGMTVGEYLLSRRNRHTPEKHEFLTDSDSVVATRSSASSEEDTEDSQRDSASQSSASSMTLPKLQAMRGGVPWNLHTPGDDNSTPYLDYADLPRAWFPRDDTDVTDDNGVTPSSRRPSLLVDAKSAALTSNGGSEQHRQVPSSSASPEEERHARWEILKDLLLIALEDDCGCSFCERCDGESSITDDESSSNTKNPSTNPTNPRSAPRGRVPENCFSSEGGGTAGRGFIGADGVLVKKMRMMSTMEGGDGDKMMGASEEGYFPLLQLSAAAMVVETPATTLLGGATFRRISGPPDVLLDQITQRATGMQAGLSNEETRDINDVGSSCNDDVIMGAGVVHKTSITAAEKALSNTFTSARVRVLKRAPVH